MTHRQRMHVRFASSVLRGAARELGAMAGFGISLIVLDALWGKSKYRKRRYERRPMVNKTYVIYESPVRFAGRRFN